jgi:hypothetical protein
MNTATALSLVPPLEPSTPPSVNEEMIAVIASTVRQLAVEAEAIVIVDPASYVTACNIGKAIKVIEKTIVATFAPGKTFWHAGHTDACKLEHEHLDPAERSERIIKEKIGDWNLAEERRQATDLRLREVLAFRIEEDIVTEEAQALQDAGDPEGAWRIVCAPISYAPPPPHRAVEKQRGIANTHKWTFNKTNIDLAAVIRHIAGLAPDAPLAHPELQRLLTLDLVATQQKVTGDREHFNVPGIQAFEDRGTSISAV